MKTLRNLNDFFVGIAMIIGIFAILIPNVLFLLPSETIDWGYWESYIIAYIWYGYLTATFWMGMLLGMAIIVVVALIGRHRSRT